METPEERSVIKACAFCGDPLVFPYMDGGVIDRNRAKCRTCKKNVFVFEKTQYQIIEGVNDNGKL